MEQDDRPVEQLTLDEMWDFDDAPASERRFQEAAAAADGNRRAELTTQQARALGLQGRFDEASALLDGIEPASPVVEVRCLLESGRLHNSAGRPADAVPLFTEAVARATEAQLTFLAVDALHMLAIADPAAGHRYTRQALAMVDATEDARTKRWAVSLHNNLGWALHDQERYDDALAEFEAAHRISSIVGTTEQEFIARWAVARCLRSLGRYHEALAIQEQLAKEDPADEYVVEELEALRDATA